MAAFKKNTYRTGRYKFHGDRNICLRDITKANSKNAVSRQTRTD